MITDRRGAFFVVQATTRGDSGPVGPWIMASQWAAAARRILGQAWVVTPEGTFEPEAAARRASRSELAPRNPRWWRRVIRPLAPEILINAYKDGLDFRAARRFSRSVTKGERSQVDAAFVWQHHLMFNSAGFALAEELKCPLVLAIDAPHVWEDDRMGVRRPGWGRLLERFGEASKFREADLVVCISEEVEEQIRIRGVEERRLLTLPNGVDLTRFKPEDDSSDLRRRLDLQDRFVVGWAGSFRPFHNVDVLIEAAALVGRKVPEIALLLVGDGQERVRLQQLTTRLGVTAVFTGTVPHEEMPKHIGAMDVAVVLGREDGFHFSPLKLKEYMACARPVLALDAGEMRRTLTHDVDAYLVEAPDCSIVADALATLHGSPGLRRRLGACARQRVETATWDRSVRLLLERLEEND